MSKKKGYHKTMVKMTNTHICMLCKSVREDVHWVDPMSLEGFHANHSSVLAIREICDKCQPAEKEVD